MIIKQPCLFDLAVEYSIVGVDLLVKILLSPIAWMSDRTACYISSLERMSCIIANCQHAVNGQNG